MRSCREVFFFSDVLMPLLGDLFAFSTENWEFSVIDERVELFPDSDEIRLELTLLISDMFDPFTFSNVEGLLESSSSTPELLMTKNIKSMMTNFVMICKNNSTEYFCYEIIEI